MDRPHLSGSDTEETLDDSVAELVPAVEDFLRAFGNTIRSYRLYEGNNPMLDRFLETLQQKMRGFWETLPLLRLQIEERRIVWEGQPVYPTGDASTDLPFLFFKDGIRELTFLPGFEDREVRRFMGVVARAPQVKEEEDDLITLLWQEDLATVRYHYVEPAAEAVELPSAPTGELPKVDAAEVRQAAAQPAGGITPEDFQETLYFLDESELRRLRDEVRREAERDLWAGVTSALFDRLEDGTPERQARVVGLLQEIFPALLSSGQVSRAAGLLGELVDLASRPELLAPAVLREVRDLFGTLASPATVQQLVQTLEETPDALRDDSVARLLGLFPPEALAPLMRATGTVSRPGVRRRLEECVQRLAEGNRGEITRLLADPDPAVVAGALRWVGRLEIGSAVGEVVRLLGSPEVEVRLAGVEALVALRAAAAAKSLLALLEDPEREVRLSAVRALGTLQLGSARPVLEEALGSKRLRAADRTEKIAFFEAYGRLAGAEGVALLDRTLNGKSWLGRGESAEIRACAALALGQVRHPSARSALTAAANDSEPVVRSAVARALKGEEAQ